MDLTPKQKAFADEYIKNGVGTLIFIAVTKAKSPAYLGSSFAFLAPAGVVISKMGYPYALGGFVAVGLTPS